MTDKEAEIMQEEMPTDCCSECFMREPECEGEKHPVGKSRRLQLGEKIVCVDGGDFHFCGDCA